MHTFAKSVTTTAQKNNLKQLILSYDYNLVLDHIKAGLNWNGSTEVRWYLTLKIEPNIWVQK